MKRFLEYALLISISVFCIQAFMKKAIDLGVVLMLLIIYLILRRFEE